MVKIEMTDHVVIAMYESEESRHSRAALEELRLKDITIVVQFIHAGSGLGDVYLSIAEPEIAQGLPRPGWADLRTLPKDAFLLPVRGGRWFVDRNYAKVTNVAPEADYYWTNEEVFDLARSLVNAIKALS